MSSRTQMKEIVGWLLTGDLGSLDAEGLLRSTGRKKELLERNELTPSLEVRHPIVSHTYAHLIDPIYAHAGAD